MTRIAMLLSLLLCPAICPADGPATRPGQAESDAGLRTYLAAKFPNEVTRVEVSRADVKIDGRVGAGGAGLELAELPVEADAFFAPAVMSSTPIRAGADGRFQITLPRRATGQDGLLSRWMVVRKENGRIIPASHARWADLVQPTQHTVEMKPRSKKGLGGFRVGKDAPVSDLDELGISAVTMNIMLGAFMRMSEGPGRTPFDYAGRKWYVDDARVAGMDRLLQEAAKRGVMVSAIILLQQPKTAPDKQWGAAVSHPDADPSGTFVMPNFTSADGARAYAAALEFLARRYMGPPEATSHGRIHHWILHNEVNNGWVWTNAGEQTPALYMDLYQKSMRLAHLIGRQYDPFSKAFISLDHHWAKNPVKHGYPSRQLMDLLVDLSHADGDFDWGIAHHPYPQDLTNPRVWEDNQPKPSFDTPKITFRNIEVLDAWARQDRVKYLGKSPRVIHLSEQGFNSRDYSEKSLTDQAAAMVYAWKKIQPLETIEVMHYHNWIDNRHEGGLRIGLRKFPDDAEDKLGKKPIWNVYRALGTKEEAAAIEFAKPILGAKAWDEMTRTNAKR